ncbi:hypothetical protein [Streptomyces sp. NPDC002057]|uniref:hypothetical protein n=1 Tax=Streptomyces sp. NPDC002057 TaxID=3154664 RepID=UPI0033232FA4
MKPLVMTVGHLRDVLDLHDAADDLPIEIHADIRDGEYASVLHLEAVEFTSTIPKGTIREEGVTIPPGRGYVMKVVLSACVGREKYARKSKLSPTT